MTLQYIKIVYAHSRWIFFCYVRDMRINYNDYTFTESIIDVLINIYVEGMLDQYDFRWVWLLSAAQNVLLLICLGQKRQICPPCKIKA